MEASGSGVTVNSGTRQRKAAGGCERERERANTLDRTKAYDGTRAQLAFVVWLCRSRDPSTRARRMRHSDRRQRKHSKHSRGGGKGTAVKLQGR